MAISETNIQRTNKGAITSRHFLFLQGPVGPFFSELANKILKDNHKVTRLNVNAGDWFDWSRHRTQANVINFKDSIEHWPLFLKQSLREHKYTDLCVYGDCRPLHRIAIDILKPLGVRIHVFEEGYIRPYYVTYERDGVNAYTSLPQDANFYLSQETEEILQPIHIPPFTKNMFWYAAIYYLAVFLGHPFFPKYKKHRLWPSWMETFGWIKRWVTYYKRRSNALRTQKRFYHRREKFYVALLQLCGDSQIQNHSNFCNMVDYMETIIKSFSKHAPEDTFLVFKNHPLDNGLSALGKAMRTIGKEYNISKRLVFIDGGRLKSLAAMAQGVITINSTAAFSALHHKTPLITLGNALYDFEGLTFQGPLEKFWVNTDVASYHLYKNFSQFLISRTQVNGNYFSKFGRKFLLSNLLDSLYAKHIDYNNINKNVFKFHRTSRKRA